MWRILFYHLPKAYYKMRRNTAILKLCCEDSKGIVAGVTRFVDHNGGNIVYLDQHTAADENRFFMRLEWEMDHFKVERDQIVPQLKLALPQGDLMSWDLQFSDVKLKAAIFVSKLSHCLFDILSRYQAGELEIEIPVIISNHNDLSEVAGSFGIPFYHIPITKENKEEQEQKEIELLKKYEIDFVVLARYMQVLTEKIIDIFPYKIINIHHSSLPAFPGAKPYHSAYKKGVKIMGATGHYVTTELDEGPIITQDVTKINFKDNIPDLIRKGKDLEKIVLSQAIYLHIRGRVLVYNHKTIVFS